jgi:hypothetical protein
VAPGHVIGTTAFGLPLQSTLRFESAICDQWLRELEKPLDDDGSVSAFASPIV